MSDRSGRIEKIKRYIERTRIPEEVSVRYTLYTDEWSALCSQCENGVLEAVAIAFDYGRAKGFRAGTELHSKKRGM